MRFDTDNSKPLGVSQRFSFYQIYELLSINRILGIILHIFKSLFIFYCYY